MTIYETETIKEKMACGKSIYVTVATNGEKISKIFLTVGKSGQCHRSLFEALQNVINIILSNGGKYEDVIDALKNIRCESPKIGVATSCVDYIAKILNNWSKGGNSF